MIPQTVFRNLLCVLIICLAPRQVKAQHCVSFNELPDLLKRGIYSDVEQITTEYYCASKIEGRWVADSLLYTKTERFNDRGYYTLITEFYRDLTMLNWTYYYQDNKLQAIVCDRNGYKRDIQQLRWVTPLYYVSYLLPYDKKLNRFHVKPAASSGYCFNEQGQLVQAFEASGDTSDKQFSTTYTYRQDTILMTTMDYRRHVSFNHSLIVLDKDDCGNPLQAIIDRGPMPILEFCRYHYYSDRLLH